MASELIWVGRIPDSDGFRDSGAMCREGGAGASPQREGDFWLLPISEGLKGGLGLEMGVFLCPCCFILWWFGSKMFTRNMYTTREKYRFPVGISSTVLLWLPLSKLSIEE